MAVLQCDSGAFSGPPAAAAVRSSGLQQEEAPEAAPCLLGGPSSSYTCSAILPQRQETRRRMRRTRARHPAKPTQLGVQMMWSRPSGSGSSAARSWQTSCPSLTSQRQRHTCRCHALQSSAVVQQRVAETWRTKAPLIPLKRRCTPRAAWAARATDALPQWHCSERKLSPWAGRGRSGCLLNQDVCGKAWHYLGYSRNLAGLQRFRVPTQKQKSWTCPQPHRLSQRKKFRFQPKQRWLSLPNQRLGGGGHQQASRKASIVCHMRSRPRSAERFIRPSEPYAATLSYSAGRLAQRRNCARAVHWLTLSTTSH
mmetsp:Transcript_19827/g.46100  ORF Transcript_19827/g.46100 Transcript_19827/m.46100 type:complete len:311 (-) Transcript_19827:368-1300(-)